MELIGSSFDLGFVDTFANEARAALADPARRHAVVVHFPVVLATFGVPVAIVTLVLRRKSIRIAAAIYFLLFAATAFAAMKSGEDAEGAIPGHLSEAAGVILDRHEALGEWLWILGLGVAGLYAISIAPSRLIGLGSRLAGLLGALVVAGWTAVVAHHGGDLVYGHGVGTEPWRSRTFHSSPSHVGGADRAAAVAASPRDPAAVALDHLPDHRAAFFAQSVAPLLATECLGCHGSRSRGGLDMRSLEGLLAIGRSRRPPVVPGDPSGSLLIEVVRGLHDDIERMPPDRPLDDQAIAILVEWIRDGAMWDDAAISAYLAPVHPSGSGRRQES
ncbi:MAG TPA: hypothetical protein PKC43_13085 [Phycisphaerales bacterium]|nr:hypothetical protein [Phycisphaerales bacterium]HMP38366.1 hypothetical protein [Phycisphaerales bacterium]